MRATAVIPVLFYMMLQIASARPRYFTALGWVDTACAPRLRPATRYRMVQHVSGGGGAQRMLPDVGDMLRHQAVVLMIVPTVPEVAVDGAGGAADATLLPSLSPSLSVPADLIGCEEGATGGVYVADVELPIADVIFFLQMIARLLRI